jgi:FtsH-binding integral membrane protein
MEEEKEKNITIDANALPGADANGDGHISQEEMEMHLEFKRKELEDADAQRDAMRKMTWFALFGMLLYPATILITSLVGADKAAKIIGDIAPTYFVAIAGLVAAFFGADAFKNKKDKK